MAISRSGKHTLVRAWVVNRICLLVKPRSGLNFAPCDLNHDNRAQCVLNAKLQAWWLVCMPSLTGSFVALKTVASRSRHSPQTGIGMVTRQNVHACGGGSPIPSLDRERSQGDVATGARTVIQHLRTCWDQRLVLEDTILAWSITSIADRIVEFTRLPPSVSFGRQHTRRQVVILNFVQPHHGGRIQKKKTYTLLDSRQGGE